MFDSVSMEQCLGDILDKGFSELVGVGCRKYGYFILGHFIEGHIMRCMDKMSAAKCWWTKHKMLAILWDREGKMPILSKYFIYHTDG